MRRSIKRESHGMNAMPRVMRFKIFSLAFLFVSLSLCQAATHTVTVGKDSCNNGLSFVDSAGVGSCSNQSTIALGDTISWGWGDNIMSHSTTSGTCIGAVCQTTPFWNSGESFTPNTFNRIFNNPGVFPYFCTVHDSSMIGTVRVLPAPATFTLQTPSIAVGSHPFTVVAGDFNNDGKLDLAVANRDDNTVTILRGIGNGTFTPIGMPIAGFNGPNSIAVADFNHDGNLDLAVTNGLDKLGSASVTILLGNGNGTFGAGTTFAVGTYPQAVIAADFDGDGKMDLALAIAPLIMPVTSDNVKVLSGNGDGTFVLRASLSTNALTPESLAAFDFNKDGKPDLAVVNSGGGSLGNRISIFLNTSIGPGSISFGSATNYSAGLTPHGIVAGMFTNSQGSPTPGIAVPNAGTNTVGVFLADSVGNLAPVSGSPFTVGNTGSPSPLAIASADFNGDGYLDLAVANFGEGTVTTLMNDAAGSFNSFTTTASEAASSSPREIAVGDFNGDGKPDMAVDNFATNDISILRNGTTFPPATPGPATHFGITVQSAGLPTPEGNPSTRAGDAFQITVTAYDAYQKIATGYTGTVTFNSSDLQAVLPADHTFTTGMNMDNGVHVFNNVILKTADPAPLVQTIGVHDTISSSINGRSSDILVNHAAASTFIVSVSTLGAIHAGTPFNFTVTAMDPFGNHAPDYGGTVKFTTSDANVCVALPANSTLTNGMGTFTAKLITVGNQTLTATDTVNGSITGNSNMINVMAGTVHFLVSPSPVTTAVGQPINITVNAVNTCDNLQPGYTGTVDNFTSTDSSATFPGNYTFTVGVSGDNGTHTFTNGVTFFTVGSQTVTVGDTFDQFFGTSPVVNVTAGATTVSLVPLPKQFIFRKSITLTANVHVTPPAAGTPTGDVSFFDGGVPLGTSPLTGTQATFTSSQWKIGRHSFTARYNGDGNYLVSPESPAVVQYKSPKPH
jgi:plastocyanin